MKSAISLRLNDFTLVLLKDLSDLQQTTKTAIIEKAVQLYAQQQNILPHPLKEYAGALSENEANDWLNAIHESRCNQTRETTL